MSYCHIICSCDMHSHVQRGNEGRITLSFFTYNIVSYINRISNEPQTIGGLFRDLECELHTLAIAMTAFITILEEITKIDDIVKRNKDFTSIITVLRSTTDNLLGFRCES